MILNMREISSMHTERDAYKLVKRCFHSACSETRSPMSEKIQKFSRDGNDLELARLEILPSDYSDAIAFRNDYSLVSYLSKWKGLKTGIDTKAVALTSFIKGEETCKASNVRLKSKTTAFVEPILHRAQRLIQRVLGEFDVTKFYGSERWGPGATSDVSRREAYLDTKITKLPIPVTAAAFPYFRKTIQEDLHWSFCILGVIPDGPYSLLRGNFLIVEGSNITTVPKSAKTDRTIAVEPRGNMFLQKAVGSYIRRRLRRFGVDLDDQRFNQDFARICKDFAYATIDLSMASDSISLELVYELLPIDWASYLDALRSKHYSLDGGKKFSKFEKFSSMGNGFTFELESLLFWGLTKASLENESNTIAIYGDDIILPQEDAHVLISTLAYCGFSVNWTKSFIDGPFFESCGRHYFNNVDVTPIYQKELVLDMDEHIRMQNRIANFLMRTADGDRLQGPWLAPWSKEIDRVQKQIRGCPLIPLGTEGDQGYLVNHSRLQKPLRWKQSYGAQWTVVRRVVSRIPADDAALLAYSFRQGVVTENPYNPNPEKWDECGLESRETVNTGCHSMTTRWIEPSWEFALD